MDYPPLVCTSLGDPGGSAYYRILLPLLTANAMGHIQFRIPEKYFVFYPTEVLKKLKPDTIVFHRTHTADQRKYVNELYNEADYLSEILKIYTIDDWVGKVPKESPHYQNKFHGKEVEKEIKKLIYFCDRLIVTNDVLANVYGYKKDTYIIPNYLSKGVWQQVYKNSTRQPKDFNRIPRIGWSGGMGHPGDLRILKEIADILGDKVRWVFLGMVPEGFNNQNAEIHKPVDPGSYSLNLHLLDLDIALAPLLENDFNKAKSNLRILEYSACEYPVIASNVLPYRDTPATLLQYKAEWWAQEILKKLEDREALQAEGKELHKWVWETHCLETNIGEYREVLSSDKIGFTPDVNFERNETIDVVITTRNSVETVKTCVESVLASIPENKTDINVIVTDNASTEVDLMHYLNDLKSNDKVTVLFSDKDYGYVNNINKGISVHNDRDVITLNSDTYVHGNWVDRLKTKAYLDPRIASVTPFTNNGTIASYPNPGGGEFNKALVGYYDDLVAEINKDYPGIDLPTPVGFCTFYKRAALRDVGLFDANAFGRGYGDENEWSMRSFARMWRNVIGLDIYVGHVGSATFGEEKKALMEKAAHVLVTRWPQYGKIIQEWIKANPLAGVRQEMDLSSIAKSATDNRILYIAHGFGGGLETYVQSQIKLHPGSIILRNNPQNAGMMFLDVAGDKYFNIPEFSQRLTSMPFLKDMFTKFKIAKISVQTTFGYDYSFPIWIQNLAKLLEVPYEVMLHDYWTICPRLRLMKDGVNFCAEEFVPDSDECNECVIQNGSGLGQLDVYDWRDMYYNFLKKAEVVCAPSNDLAKRISDTFFRTLPSVDIKVVPHESEITIGEYPEAVKKDYKEGDEIRIAVIGSISPDKGSLLIRDCANYCKENNLPVKFVVFGDLIDQSVQLKMLEETSNLSILKAYEEVDIKTMLRLNACHIAFFAALWPETYSYTLSHAFKAGLWPVSYDIGAIADRIREMNFGSVLPYHYSKDVITTVNRLIDIAKGRYLDGGN